MTCIHNIELSNISEYNLLHDIINPPKRTNILNIHNSPIIHRCINTRKGKAKFNNIRIILDNGCISTIVMGSMVKKLILEKYAPMQWNTQAVNITNNFKVEVDFTLPSLSTMKIMT